MVWRCPDEATPVAALTCSQEHLAQWLEGISNAKEIDAAVDDHTRVSFDAISLYLASDKASARHVWDVVGIDIKQGTQLAQAWRQHVDDSEYM